jgi:hypothetical protein
MPLDDTSLAHSDKWEILMKVFLPSLIGVIVMLAAYAIYRWKVRYDLRSMESLKADRMRLEMEALAAEKKALRKLEQTKARTMHIARPEPEGGDFPDDPEAPRRPEQPC